MALNRVAGMLACVVALLLERPVAGQAEPATVYRNDVAGIQLRMAGGFRVLGQREGVVLFGSNETPGMVLLRTGDRFSAAELQAAARDGYEDEGVALRPAGLAHSVPNGIAFPVRGTVDGAEVLGLLAGVRASDGRCFVLLAATTPPQWPKLEVAARIMAAGIEILAPAAAPAMDESLHTYFSGTRLTFYFSRTSSDSSFRGTEQIYLCGDSTFRMGTREQARFDVPQAMGTARSGSAGEGRWHAAGGILSLHFHDGRRVRYEVTRAGQGQVYLNGSKYFRAGYKQCP